MGLRFRKSIKIAPGLKINLNKNSVSATVGTKGAHYTINSKGKRTTTVGIPGTGISYSQSTGSTQNSSMKNDTANDAFSYSSGNSGNNNYHDKKKWYQKTGWIIALLVLFFPVGLFLMWKYANWKKPVKGIITGFWTFIAIAAITSPTLDDVSLSANTSKTYDINQKVEIKASISPSDYDVPSSAYETSGGELTVSDDSIYFSASKSGTYKVWLDYAGVESNTLKIKVVDKKAIAKKKAEEKEAKRKAEEEAKKKAEEEAAKKAEEERIAAEQAAAKQAEQERIAAEQAAAKKKAEEEAAAKVAEQNRITDQKTSQSTQSTVYWVSSGDVYHSSQNCRTLKRSKNIYSGTISQSGKSRACKVCH